MLGYVFARLHELCTQHGCHFQAIDLRWSVHDEARLDLQTMNICLDEWALAASFAVTEPDSDADGISVEDQV